MFKEGKWGETMRGMVDGMCVDFLNDEELNVDTGKG